MQVYLIRVMSVRKQKNNDPHFFVLSDVTLHKMSRRVYIGDRSEAPEQSVKMKDSDGDWFYKIGFGEYRTYVDSMDEVPDYVEVQRGDQGGIYYIPSQLDAGQVMSDLDTDSLWDRVAQEADDRNDAMGLARDVFDDAVMDLLEESDLGSELSWEQINTLGHMIGLEAQDHVAEVTASDGGGGSSDDVQNWYESLRSEGEASQQDEDRNNTDSEDPEGDWFEDEDPSLGM